MRYLIGIEGGGTRTTLAFADLEGRELHRCTGPAGLVDPRRPEAAAELLARLVRDGAAEAGLAGPAAALCAGLAGVGNRAERSLVEQALARSGVATRVRVLTDGQTALHGAFAGAPGILLIAGTGSVAYARTDDGRIVRCGGWGMVVGDEGSGFAIGRAALTAALRAEDGRGPATRLLPTVLDVLRVEAADAIPPWAGRAEKAEIAALTPHVVRLAEEGDAVADAILRDAAAELAGHAVALEARLRPWRAPPAVVVYGGVASAAAYRGRIAAALEASDPRLRLREPIADAVAGALRHAREAAAGAADPPAVGTAW
jgi:glucosamine kinase